MNWEAPILIDDIQSKTVNSIDSKCSLPMTLVIKLGNIDRKIIATAVYLEYAIEFSSHPNHLVPSLQKSYIHFRR